MTEKEKLLGLVVLILLLSGTVIGFLISGYVVQKEWEEYNEWREKDIKIRCTCVDSLEVDYSNFSISSPTEQPTDNK